MQEKIYKNSVFLTPCMDCLLKYIQKMIWYRGTYCDGEDQLVFF